MRINNIIKEYPRKQETYKTKRKEFTENDSNQGIERILETTNSTKQMSIKDIYSIMNQTRLLEEELQTELQEQSNIEENLQTELQEQSNVEENLQIGTDSDIIVKPDGSRVLVVTTNIGGMKTTMSLEISKPTNMLNNYQEISIETSKLTDRISNYKKEASMEISNATNIVSDFEKEN